MTLVTKAGWRSLLFACPLAGEVEKVKPDLVARDTEGKVYTVRYEAVNAMLLNEFLNEHRKVEELEKQVAVLTGGPEKVARSDSVERIRARIVGENQ